MRGGGYPPSASDLATCAMGEAARVSLPGGGAVEIDAKKLEEFLTRAFAAMNSVFEDCGFPANELEAISNGVIEVIEQAGMA